MQRAWAAAATVLVLGVLAHYSLLAVGTNAAALALGAVVLLLAGFVAGYLAQRMKLLVGASVAVPAAVLFGLADVVFGSLGQYSTAWPGPLNSLLAAIIILPVGLILCTLGAWIGAMYSMRRAGA